MQFALFLVFLPLLAALCSANTASIDLDSMQQRSLKDAEYYLNEMERALKALEPKAEGVKNGSSPMDQNALHGAMNEIQYAGQKLSNAHSRLQQLPATDASVKKVTDRSAQLAQRLLNCHQAFEAAKNKGSEAIAGAGAIEADVKRLEALSVRIANGDFLQSAPVQSLETVRDLPRMIEFRQSMEQQYAAVLGEHVGTNMRNTIQGFDYRLEKYRESMTQVTGLLPASVRRDLEQAQTIADLAVQRKNASSFQNGVLEQYFDRAQVNLELLEAIAGPNADSKALATEKATIEKKIAAAHSALETEILSANTAPNDLYNQGDKAAILALVEKEWKKSAVKGKVLAMRIPMAAWERSEGIRWAHDRYELHDFSELQVAISIEADATTAHTYYAHIEKDHLKGDKTRVRIDDKGEVPLYRRVLLSNWK